MSADAEETRKIADMKEQAKRELTEWYKNRDEQMEKTRKNNR